MSAKISILPAALAVISLSLALAACSSSKAKDAPPETVKEGGKDTPKENPEATTDGAASTAPLAEKNAVTDEYHGEKVVDEYRWLEDWDDPKVQAWSKDLDSYTRSSLAAMPQVSEISQRVGAVLSHSAVSYHGISQVKGSFFAMKDHPPKKQELLVRFSSLSDLKDEKVVLDPNILDTTGSTTIDFYRPSPDGKMVAVSLSKGGSESGDVHVFDVESGKQIHEVVPRVNGGTAGGDLTWQTDSKGFFYTRYPRGEERPAKDANFYTQVFFHSLGTTTDKDRYEIGKDFPRIGEIELIMHAKTGRLLATVQDGDGGEFAHYIRNPPVGKSAADWRKLTKFGDGHLMVAFGPGTDLFVVSTEDAPRGKVMRMPAKADISKAKTIIPESEDTVIASFWGSRSLQYIGERLFVRYQLGGPSELRIFDAKGKAQQAPEQLSNASVGSITRLEDESVLFSQGSWTTPSAWHRFDSKSNKTLATALVEEAPVDLSGVRVERKFATSKDGTKVPLNILIPPGAKLDGSTPAVVTGYGGYGVSLGPRYRSRSALMLEQGLIVAVVNLRGGGEYGEKWHREGSLTKKQNVFDDFAAALEYMVKERYTSSDRLIIQGGSNGGLLMGVLLVQHPKLMKAVVSHVGIYDMLRVELSPNGAFNITEFGTVTKADEYKALRAYSPYHHVDDGQEYPDIFLLTGANDPRVDPMQSRKFAARLLAAGEGGANKSGSRVLLRTSFNTGHGGGTPLDERISQSTDVIAFVLKQLGRSFVAKN